MQQDKVWELVDALGKSIPFRKEKVEALLGVTLEPGQEDAERIYYRARTLQPGPPGVALGAVDLRVHKSSRTWPGFLVIELPGAGLTRGDVQRRYPGGKLEHPRPGPPPQGVSPDNKIYYVLPQPWGVVSFGFRVRAPDLLDSISFDPMPGR